MEAIICAIIKNEHLYLKEWLDYHLDLGFSHIYLFEDYSSFSHKDITDNYKNVTLSTLQNFGILNDCNSDIIGNRQRVLYDKCLVEFKDKYDWLCFIDIDEFITLTESKNINDFLTEYESFNGIYLYWKMFNANGEIYYKDEPVRKRFTQEAKKFSRDYAAGFKSFVNLHHNEGLLTHHCVKNGVNTAKLKTVMIRCYKKAYISHYFTKSLEEWVWRFTKRGDVANCYRQADEFFISNPDLKYIQENPIDIWNECISSETLQKKNYIHNFVKNNNIIGFQIACGGNVFKRWFNTDILDFDKDVYYMDATKPFPIFDEEFNFIYMEHFFEHVAEKTGLKLLKEIYRVLKPGGVFRMSLPTQDFFNKLKTQDCSDYIKFHFDNYAPKGQERTIGNLIKNFSTFWGHKIIYETSTLISILESIGFKNIKLCNIQESEHEELQNIEHHGDFIGEKFNELESTVFECSKIE